MVKNSKSTAIASPQSRNAIACPELVTHRGFKDNQMPNYKLLSGAFAGSIVEENQQILDVSFADLDDDMQLRVREWAEEQLERKYIEIDGGANYARKGSSNAPISINEIKEDYENSWDSEEADEDADLKSLSEW